LRVRAAGERCQERAGDIADAGRRIALALIEVDRALRDRDRLVAEIGMKAGSLWLEAWPLAGRISHTASQAFRFLEEAARNGAMTQREFDDEFEQARKADLWR